MVAHSKSGSEAVKIHLKTQACIISLTKNSLSFSFCAHPEDVEKGRQIFKSQNDYIDANVWPKAKAGNQPESQILDSGKWMQGLVILSGPGVD